MSRELPANIPIDKLRDIYRKSLAELSDSLIAKIHSFIKRPVDPNVKEAEFQVFPDEYCDQESSIWMYFSGTNNKVDNSDDSLFPGRSLEFYEDFRLLPTLDIDAYEDFDYTNTLVSLIIDWFAECWWKAGGWYYTIPVTLYGHEGFGNQEPIKLTNKNG